MHCILCNIHPILQRFFCFSDAKPFKNIARHPSIFIPILLVFCQNAKQRNMRNLLELINIKKGKFSLNKYNELKRQFSIHSSNLFSKKKFDYINLLVLKLKFE